MFLAACSMLAALTEPLELSQLLSCCWWFSHSGFPQFQENPVPCFHACERVKPLPGLDRLPAHVTWIEQPGKACRYNSAQEAEVQLQDEWK